MASSAPMPKRDPKPDKTQSETSPPRAVEPRGARRKRETRERLLRAAFELIAERGADAVAINEITEAADVGFGSFYNHFESKDAIHTAVLRMVFDGFGSALDELSASIEDPAEKVSVATRHAIATATREPLWGQLLLREWYRPETFPSGLGPRLLRDIIAGVAGKRFKVADPLVALVLAGGTVVAAVGLQLAVGGLGSKLVDQAGLSGVDIDRRVASTLLQALGIKQAEAETIAGRALPILHWTPNFSTSESS